MYVHEGFPTTSRYYATIYYNLFLVLILGHICNTHYNHKSSQSHYRIIILHIFQKIEHNIIGYKSAGSKVITKDVSEKPKILCLFGH